MRVIVLLALASAALAVPFKSENDEPKSDITTQNLIPNIEEDKDLVNAVNLLEETEKELEDSEIAKKSPTTVCVEVQPKNPYEKPYTVCEPVNHSHGPVVQPPSTYGAGAGNAAGAAGAGAGYKPQAAGYQNHGAGQGGSASYKGPAAGLSGYHQQQFGPSHVGPYNSAVAGQPASSQYGASGAGAQFGSAQGGQYSPVYNGANAQYNAPPVQQSPGGQQFGGALNQYGGAAGGQYGPDVHSGLSHFTVPSSYGQYGPSPAHGAGQAQLNANGYRESENENDSEIEHINNDEALGSVHKLLNKKKGGSYGGSHSHGGGYRAADAGYGPSGVVPSFVVANQPVSGNKHYTQTSASYTPYPPAYSIATPAGFSPTPSASYSSLAFQSPALSSYSVASPAYLAYQGASSSYPSPYPAPSVFSSPATAYSAPVQAFSVPSAGAYSAVQTLPALPSYSVSNAAPAVYQAAAIQTQAVAKSQAYTAPVQAQSQTYSVPVITPAQASLAAYPQLAPSAAASAAPQLYAQSPALTTYSAQPPCPTNYLFSCAPSIRAVPCSQSFQPPAVQVTPYVQQQQVSGQPLTATYTPTYLPGKISVYRDAEEDSSNQTNDEKSQERSNGKNSEGLPVQPKSSISNVEQIKQDQMAMETIARMNELASQNQKGQKKLTEEQNTNKNNGNSNNEDKKVGSEATSMDGQGISKASS